MFSTLRTRFGIPGVISVIALVFAMLGGAYAASDSGNGSGKASASAKVKKGARGPKGETGPAGPQGIPGATGKDGKNGANGADGTTGSAGANGKSVNLTTTAPGVGGCIEGGVSVEVEGTPASKKYICDGPEGPPGAGGGGFADTLPIGKTETGAWSFIEGGSFPIARVSLSFNIPLAQSIPADHTVFIPEGGPNPDATHCPGTVEAPEATSGYLCVYGGAGNNANFSQVVSPNTGPFGVANGTGVTGAIVEFAVEAPAYRSGSFAVTG